MSFTAHPAVRRKRDFGAGPYMQAEKKPVLVGSFYGALPDAKKHAEAATARLKERIRKHSVTTKKRP